MSFPTASLAHKKTSHKMEYRVTFENGGVVYVSKSPTKDARLHRQQPLLFPVWFSDEQKERIAKHEVAQSVALFLNALSAVQRRNIMGSSVRVRSSALDNYIEGTIFAHRPVTGEDLELYFMPHFIHGEPEVYPLTCAMHNLWRMKEVS